MQFVHLGIYTEFSITESIVRIPDLVKRATADGMPALALTDLSNLHAAVKFYRDCLEVGIKPILGATLRLNDAEHKVTLLAMTDAGWRNLTELVSKGFTHGQQQGIPCVHKDWILKQNHDLIVLLGQHSDVGGLLASGNPQKAEPLLDQWREHFGNRAYLALSRTGRAGENQFIEQAVELASRFQVPVVAHNDVHFLQAKDFEAHEARVCIADGYVLADQRRPRHYTEEQHFKSAEQMQQLFADIPSAIANSYHIAQRCNVQLRLGTYFLPDYPIPDGFTIDSYFAHLSQKGLEQRLNVLYPEAQRDEDWPHIRTPYDERLKYEVDIIVKMGFPGYFLIVMDFIQWAKNNGVPVGPGRGSGAGSLVAYSLKITDLDPLRYELLFERFLNPERVSMPDFDVDFCIAGRDRVIDYVSQHYGREAVSQIATFGTMAAKGAIRDVARVLSKSYGLADRISKLIPTKPLGVDLAQAIEMEPQLKDLVTNPNNPDHEDAAEIWEMALKLEGITRNTGKHAGGVVIAPGKITDFSAVCCDEDGSNRVSQFDKDDVESAGLVKFDFLGLRNLTVIDEAVQAINAVRKKHGEELLDLDKIALDDAATYKLLQNTKTTAVFQLESTGMKKYLGKLRPSNIEDIIAMCALYRPGPLDAGMVDMYIDRKHGREEVVYDHPDLEGILSNTYGVIVYQEQVMQISQVLAGYTLGGADMLRRAMGKKKPEEMAKQRNIFVEGAANRGIDAQTSGGIFDLMEKFAGYGFNKSHSAAYGVVAYHTAWLKAHYASDFMAAVLSSEMQNTDSVVFIIDDCRGIGLEVLPPCVNQSLYRFHATDSKTIVYGLGAIKGVGEHAMLSVIQSRQRDGAYLDLFDFCHRIDLKKMNKRTLEALIRAGALDCLGQERSSLMAQLPEAVQAAEQARSNRETGMMDLFGEVAELQRKPAQPIKPWRDEVRLKGEKDTLGLYLTGHPIDVYRNELKAFIPAKLNEISPTRRGSTTVFAGLVLDVANFPNRVVITLDDGTARLEVSCNHERFSRYKQQIILEQVIVVEGEIYEREGFDKPMARLHKAFSLNEIRQKRAQHIVLELNEAQLQQLNVNELKAWLRPHSQQYAQQNQQQNTSADAQHYIPLYIQLQTDYAHAQIQLSDDWMVVPCDELLSHLRDEVGAACVRIDYHVKSKALTSVAASHSRARKTNTVRSESAPPNSALDMNDAMDAYHAETAPFS